MFPPPPPQIYFVLSTMTSIGYGDLSPFTNKEIMWELVVAAVGLLAVCVGCLIVCMFVIILSVRTRIYMCEVCTLTIYDVYYRRVYRCCFCGVLWCILERYGRNGRLSVSSQIKGLLSLFFTHLISMALSTRRKWNTTFSFETWTRVSGA